MGALIIKSNLSFLSLSWCITLTTDSPYPAQHPPTDKDSPAMLQSLQTMYARHLTLHSWGVTGDVVQIELQVHLHCAFSILERL